MKDKKKLLLILIIGILVFTPQILPFSYQRTSHSIVVLHPNSQDTSKNLVKIDKPYEIVYHGLNDSNKQIINGSAYKIDVFVQKNTTLGILRYLPIYKPVSFKSKISYKWKNPEAIGNQDSLDIQSGEFEISGNCNLLGAYNETNAEQLINELINNSIMTQIQKDIKNRFSFK